MGPLSTNLRGRTSLSISSLNTLRSYHSPSQKMASFVRDGIFKAVFSDQKNPKKLMSFLESLQDCSIGPLRKIERVEFQNPYFPAYSPGEKDVYVDVICKVWYQNEDKPEIHVIEMQRAEQEGYVKRWDFYASRCYTNELLKAKKYDQLLKVHVVALMSFDMKYPSDTYSLVGKNSGVTIDESRSLTLISLADISPEIIESDSLKKKWCHLIKYSGTSHLNRFILAKDPILSEAMQDLSQLHQTEKNLKTPSRISKGMPWHLTQRLIQSKIDNRNK